MIMYVSIELASLFILYWAEEYKGIRYTPISDRTPSSTSQRTLERRLKDCLEYLAHDSILGWAIKKNGNYGKYRANVQSIRSDGIYEKIPPNNVIRIASFGYSFTHGDEVKNGETWQEVMNSLDEDLEVMNFGIPAHSLDCGRGADSQCQPQRDLYAELGRGQRPIPVALCRGED